MEIGRRREAARAKNLPYLAAELENEVAGFAYVVPYRGRPAYRSSIENSVYVAPEAWGRGVGYALLGRLIELRGGRGFRQMVAIIGDSANEASIGLHRRHGFRQAGVLRSVGYKHARWVDSVIMQRALGEGDGGHPAL